MNKYAEPVYKLLKNIPKGKVVTYGRIAKFLKIPSARLIGNILHNNKDPENIPCHRVVFSDGSLASAYAFGGLIKQKEKLKSEGVNFIGNKVDLEKYLFSL